ncbi:MAG: FhaA domain-containing protein [Bacillota bacterium]
MGFLSKLEKLSEKYIEGFFRQKFAGQLQPAEIARRLAREMRDRRTVSVSHTYVPGEFTVFVSAGDYENIRSFATSLTAELAGFVAAKAAEKGYVLAGGPKVTIEPDETMGLGQLKIISKFGSPPPENHQPAAGETTLVASRERLSGMPGTDTGFDRTLTRMPAVQPPRAMLVVKAGPKDAYDFPLGKHGITVGRRRTNDLCLLDTGISRDHARIDFKDGSYYITDLGSTNGTIVNGAKISSRKLVPGDVIKLGATWLEFRVV